MSTTTDLSTLKINYLTQAQYDEAKRQGIVNENELYLTPATGSGVTDVEVDGVSVVSGGVAEITMPTVPTKVSDLTNDSGFITGYTETDPTVPSWAKASSKPSYTASEVGAVPTSRTVNGKALSSNITLSASDVSALPSSTAIPTITDTYSGTSSNGMSGKAVKSAIDALDGSVTGTAGSSKTLTAFSQTDGKVSATFGSISITKSQVSDFPTIPSTAADVGAVPTSRKVNGKALSSDITLSASDVSALPSSTSIPSKTSDLTNDSGFITGYTETDPVFSASAAHGITSSDISNWNGKSDFSGSYDDLTDKPTIPTVPTNVSAFTNDAGYITGYTETDPTVPSWAKQASKPTYTASEVGALPSTTVIPSALTDLTNDMTVSDFTNDAGYLTSYTETDPTVPSWAKESTKPSYSASEISGLVDFFYPVGSYYETSDTTFDPNTAWGGTWSLEAEGQVHVSGSASGTYQVSGALTDTSDGGEESVTLTDAQVAHGHGFTQATYKATGGAVANKAAFNTGGMSGNTTHTHPITDGFHWKAYSSSDRIDNNVCLVNPYTSGTYFFHSKHVTGNNTTIAHTHQVPEHGHTFTQPTISINTNGSVANLSGASSTRTAHSNMQPYIIVNRWHRTA